MKLWVECLIGFVIGCIVTVIGYSELRAQFIELNLPMSIFFIIIILIPFLVAVGTIFVLWVLRKFNILIA